jgi:hypothetical protein
LDRSLERVALGKEWKFSVVQALVVRNKRAKDVLSPSLFQRLERFVKEGAFYTVAAPLVATQSS